MFPEGPPFLGAAFSAEKYLIAIELLTCEANVNEELFAI